MGYALLQPQAKNLSIEDHARMIMVLTRHLLRAGLGDMGAGGKNKMGRFDVTSLHYERAKNNLLDAIYLARLYEYPEVPFFLSHSAIIAVQKRLQQSGKYSDKYQELLARAHHQVFICEVEDLLDRASNHNFDAAQSKRGYGGDRAEIILKLHKVIAEYGKSLQILGRALPSEWDLPRILILTAPVRQEREMATTKETLKKLNWSLHRVMGEFDLSRILIPADAKKHPQAIIFLMAMDGHLALLSDAWRGPILAGKFRSTAAHSSEPVILGKFLLEELWAELENGYPILRVRIETGRMQIKFAEANGTGAGTIYAGSASGTEDKAKLRVTLYS